MKITGMRRNVVFMSVNHCNISILVFLILVFCRPSYSCLFLSVCVMGHAACRGGGAKKNSGGGAKGV